MEHVMDSIPGIANLKPVDCPQCAERLPTIRIPDSVFQMLWGGWTCPKCGHRMDKWGKSVDGGDEQNPT
jgi:hypothetical protein